MLSPKDVLASSKTIGTKYASMMDLERRGRLAAYKLTRAAYARDLTTLLRVTPPTMPKCRHPFAANIIRSWRIVGHSQHMYAPIEHLLTPDEWTAVLDEVHPNRPTIAPQIPDDQIPF